MEIPIIHPTDKDIEDFIMPFLDTKEINEYVFAWKAGTLVKENEKYKLREKDGAYLTGYGTKIEKKALSNFICHVSKDVAVGDNFEMMYKRMLELNPPHNFGAVYMINFLFFYPVVNGLYMIDSHIKQ